jgi:flagellin
MALVVNTNVSALNAQRNLGNSGVQFEKALQRLSSGLRINNAADDAAGLAISTRLGNQVRGLNQAIRNANDGSALLGTAEGALSEITNIVTRIKELSVQSANSTNSSSDRSSLNSEVQSLISEVTRIATQTKFGSTLILDGSFSGQFQVGTESGQTVSASIANYRASSLSGTVASQDLTLEYDTTAVGVANANAYTGLSATGLLIAGTKGTSYTRATVAGDDTASAVSNATSAIAAAKVINEATPNTGVTATVTEAQQTFSGTFGTAFTLDTTTTNKILQINGQYVTGAIGTGSAGRDALVSAINSQVSGVVAEAVGVTSFTLTASDGRNISVLAGGATTTGTAGFDLFTTTAATALGTESVVARGGLTLQSSADFTTTPAVVAQIGGEGAATAGNTALSSLDISSVSGANTAMFVADGILDTISTARGNLGAIQNRLAVTVANLAVVSEKVSDARSRILDADFAAETAALTKAQILQQAGISILSQANSAPQQVLSLLRQ